MLVKYYVHGNIDFIKRQFYLRLGYDSKKGYHFFLPIISSTNIIWTFSDSRLNYFSSSMEFLYLLSVRNWYLRILSWWSRKLTSIFVLSTCNIFLRAFDNISPELYLFSSKELILRYSVQISFSGETYQACNIRIRINCLMRIVQSETVVKTIR